MTVSVFRPRFAPHPLNEDRKSRAARLAEEVRRSTSSALRLATAGEVARAIIDGCRPRRIRHRRPAVGRGSDGNPLTILVGHSGRQQRDVA